MQESRVIRKGLLPRRDFLRVLAGSAAFAGFPQIGRSAEHSVYPFLEISALASGITWSHVAGTSAEKYLPESTGAGCAFFDYDNDGWMDIYLVNSGKCDFFDPSPPLRNALYRNNHDGTLQMSPRKPAFWVVDMGWE